MPSWCENKCPALLHFAMQFCPRLLVVPVEASVSLPAAFSAAAIQDCVPVCGVLEVWI